MTKIDPGAIVVGTDGSPDADRAVEWAADQAARERRPLVVVTAARPIPPVVAAGPGATYAIPADEVIASARAVADAAAALAKDRRPELDVTARAILGDPRTVLLDLADDAELLVVGSRGRGRVRSGLLGSVSASVSKQASCPVVVCRPGGGPATPTGVVVGADGTPESLPVIAFAFRQASLRSQPLTMVHCYWDGTATLAGADPTVGTDPDFQMHQLLLAETAAGFRERYPDVDVELRAVRGAPRNCLVAMADGHDLVVMGRHPVRSIARRLGGALSTDVMERSQTTVAVVPEARAAS